MLLIFFFFNFKITEIDNVYDTNLALFADLLDEKECEIEQFFESKKIFAKKSHLLDPSR